MCILLYVKLICGVSGVDIGQCSIRGEGLSNHGYMCILLYVKVIQWNGIT